MAPPCLYIFIYKDDYKCLGSLGPLRVRTIIPAWLAKSSEPMFNARARYKTLVTKLICVADNIHNKLKIAKQNIVEKFEKN